MSPVYMDVTKTMKKVLDHMDRAGKQEVDIVLFPELILASSYYALTLRPDLAETVAQEIPGKATDQLAEKCREYGMYAIAGLAERGPVGTYYNTAVLINRKGDVEGVHRKCHVYNRTEGVFRAGSKYVVFNTDFARIGILICYDLFFPETARMMALKGAEMIFHPAAIWKEQGFNTDNMYTQIFPSRALDNRIFLASVNQVGNDPDLKDYFIGHSIIVSPLGDILAEAGRDETIIKADIDFDEWRTRRRNVFNVFSDRRPNQYSILAQEYDEIDQGPSIGPA